MFARPIFPLLLSFTMGVGCVSSQGANGAETSTIPRAPFDTSHLSAQEIAQQLLPRHRSGSLLLAPITDTSFLERYSGIPEGRYASSPQNFALDMRFKEVIGELIAEGVIRSNTLVLDDSGHSIPNLARVLQEPGLDIVGTVHFPWNEVQPLRRPRGVSETELEALIDVSVKALADQAQTFGDLIEKGQVHAAGRLATSLYVAIDGERYIDLRTQNWPPPMDFQLFGIVRVVVLIERAKVWEYGNEDMAPDLRPFVESLSRVGLPVQVIGIDSRVGSISSYGRPYGRPISDPLSRSFAF